tara:strand:- start:323 stop:526 length:204 start_codon:yes stop_codon:yes gene_type:complete
VEKTLNRKLQVIVPVVGKQGLIGRIRIIVLAIVIYLRIQSQKAIKRKPSMNVGEGQENTPIIHPIPN